MIKPIHMYMTCELAFFLLKIFLVKITVLGMLTLRKILRRKTHDEERKRTRN